ncbi:MAG TPA: multicopper oxidase domain-containing protein [Desulfuromonadales bacterium]|nr:multicopper oxidase domain-containing protein [Desulfuromonadales bacterium]
MPADGAGITPPVADFFGPPPADDPSAFTDGIDNAVIETLPHANEGTLEGPNGALIDPGANNVVQEALQQPDGDFNVPTNSRPSPLFGALPFTQQMLRFEEFGTEPLSATGPVPANSFPAPVSSASGPAPAALESFLAQPGIAPFPSEFANTLDENPWKAQVASYLGRELEAPPAEGRPPGRGWAHQRWNEFFPQIFYKTAQAGARVNGGFRDSRQLHRYQAGEFGPGGLYHNTAGVPGTEGTTSGIAIRFHPAMPIQNPDALWTFDGTLPPKLLMVRYGQPVLMRHYNALPIDPSVNRGFGIHTISTHEHNGHNPAESDGYTNAFFFPGQFYDYRWPITLAGYDTINTSATDPRAAFPCSPGETLFVNDANPGRKTCQDGKIQIRGDWRETMSSHWFHDHMLDFTAQNVYKGNAAMMNYYSALDRGNEAFDDGVNLRFPSGTALPWGNRDYDVNVVVADKAWDQSGQLWFNIFNMDGFLGDQLLTNWLYKPYFEVRARSYRFRMLNGSVSRYMTIALVHQLDGEGGEIPGPPNSGISYNRVPFHLIANDGNIMEHSVAFDGTLGTNMGQLPTMSVGERYDIIVNFSQHGIQPGDRLYFVNVLEHSDGQRPGDRVTLEAILSGAYNPQLQDTTVPADGVPDAWIGGDPAVGPFLELRVQPYTGQDLSMDPSEFVVGGKKMIPLPIDRNDPALATARHRTFEFDKGGTDAAPWTIRVDEDIRSTADPRRISAAPQLSTGPTAAGFEGVGTLEIWSLVGGNGGWSHPIHIHFEEGVILSRDGQAPPEWERWARKDLYRIGREDDSSDEVVVAIRFREFAGSYMEHCHNTQHEDHAMLLRWDIEHPGQVQLMPTPLPTWDGVEYVDSAALPTFRTGDGVGPPL